MTPTKEGDAAVGLDRGNVSVGGNPPIDTCLASGGGSGGKVVLAGPGMVAVIKEEDDVPRVLAARIARLGFFGHTLAVPAQTPSPSPPASPPLKGSGFGSTTTTTTTLSMGTVAASCLVRTRIPSEYCDQPLSLLLYSNSEDSEEHLALVFGYDPAAPDGIRSASLERIIAGESERDRRTRGASVLPTSITSSSLTPEIATTTSTSLSPSNQISRDPPLARIHSCCFTGETIGSSRCDCREQLIEAMKLMSNEGRGVILYLKQEGRGIGLRDKMRAYNLIDQGFDTQTANLELGHPADARSYKIATAILRDLHIPSVRLLTNNPHKVESIVHDGVVVSARVPMVPASWGGGSSDNLEVQDRDEYLVTKVQKMGHILDIPDQISRSVGSMSIVGTPKGARGV